MNSLDAALARAVVKRYNTEGRPYFLVDQLAYVDLVKESVSLSLNGDPTGYFLLKYACGHRNYTVSSINFTYNGLLSYPKFRLALHACPTIIFQYPGEYSKDYPENPIRKTAIEIHTLVVSSIQLRCLPRLINNSHNTSLENLKRIIDRKEKLYTDTCYALRSRLGFLRGDTYLHQTLQYFASHGIDL